MTESMRNLFYFALMAGLIAGTGYVYSWNAALFILNFGLISAIMALGVNLQWGFAGLFNVGIMGFVALGGLATVLVAQAPEPAAWSAGGFGVILALALGAATIVGAIMAYQALPKGRLRSLAMCIILVVGFVVFRAIFDPATQAIEAINSATAGHLGGLNLLALNRAPSEFPRADYWVLLAWPVGGLLAAGAAWIIGKTALGLRSDYLAIATLGIAEIVIAVLKNEDWLARGVKNVIGLPRPAPYEVALQNSPDFLERAAAFGLDPVTASTIWVKLVYAGLFSVVLLALFWMAQRALHSPWGRMMRAIRDNEVAAEAMGKDVTSRHLQVFVLGSAICGIAGAMMTTLDGQLTPGSYQPLRFTFLIWVMVIVGGSGSNLGSVLGGFLIWWLWVMVEPISGAFAGSMNDAALWLQAAIGDDGGRAMRGLGAMASGLAAFTTHIEENVQHFRLLAMGIVLLCVLRFSPRGLIPER